MLNARMLRCLGIVGLLLGLSQPVAAQEGFRGRGGERAPAQELPPFPGAPPANKPQGPTESMTVKGTIKAISGSVVQVGNDTTEQWFVKMPGEAQQVNLVGKALPAWVRPGMMVRFVATFDAKGKAQDPVHKLDIITLRRPKQGEMPEFPGVYPTTAFGVGAAAAGGAGLGEKPAPGAAKDQGGPLKVVGQLTALKNQEFAVSTGQMLVRGELKDDAEINVDIADYRWMQVGDAIEAHGWYYPYLPGQVQANRVTIKATEPLGSAPAEKTLNKPEAKPRPELRPKGRVKGKPKEGEPLPF